MRDVQQHAVGTTLRQLNIRFQRIEASALHVRVRALLCRSRLAAFRAGLLK